ncbi:MAG: hypothetical protein AABY75_02465 [Bacteroidota bacterium]
MKRSIRNGILLFLAAVFGPLTSGYPVVLSMCGTGNDAPVLCRMADCTDELPGGPAISSPACCVPHVITDGVSRTYVKPHQPLQVGPDNIILGVSQVVDAVSVPSTFSFDGVIPTVHAPPLYLSHHSLLI